MTLTKARIRALRATLVTAAALALQQGIPPSQLDPAILVRQLAADGVKL